MFDYKISDEKLGFFTFLNKAPLLEFILSNDPLVSPGLKYQKFFWRFLEIKRREK